MVHLSSSLPEETIPVALLDCFAKGWLLFGEWRVKRGKWVFRACNLEMGGVFIFPCY